MIALPLRTQLALTFVHIGLQVEIGSLVPSLQQNGPTVHYDVNYRYGISQSNALFLQILLICLYMYYG